MPRKSGWEGSLVPRGGCRLESNAANPPSQIALTTFLLSFVRLPRTSTSSVVACSQFSPVVEKMRSGAPRSGGTTAPAASPADGRRLRRDLDATRADVQAMAQRVATRNASYLLREQELSQAIKTAVVANEQRQRGSGGVAGSPMSPRASSRVKELQREIELAEEALGRKQEEEVLAGTAVARLQRHVDTLEEDAANATDVVAPVTELIHSLVRNSSQHRAYLCQFLSLPTEAAKGKAGDASRRSAHVRNSILGDNKQAAQFLARVSSLCDVASGVKHDLETTALEALIDEGELRSSVYLSLEDTQRRLRAQLEEQSAVLVEAQSTMEALAIEVEKCRAARDTERSRVSALDREIASIDSEQARKLSEDALRKQLEKVNQDLLHERRVCEEAVAEHASAQSERSAQAAEAPHLEQLVAQADAQYDDAAARKSKAADEKAAVVHKIAGLEHQLATLESEQRKLKAGTEAANDDCERVLQKVQEGELARDRLAVDVRAANKKSMSLDQNAAEKTHRCDALESECARERQRLEQAKREKAVLLAELRTAERERQESERASQEVEAELRYHQKLLPVHHPLREDPDE